MLRAISFFLLFATLAVAQQPLFRVVDIDVGATERVQFSDGKTANVKLLSISETLDNVRSAIRDARAEVEINGARHPFLRKLSSASDHGWRASRLRRDKGLL